MLLNGKTVVAKNIVNGQTVYQDNTCESVEYYHLECEKHSAIVANGVLAESYLDVNNRYVFENSIKLRKINLKSKLLLDNINKHPRPDNINKKWFTPHLG